MLLIKMLAGITRLSHQNVLWLHQDICRFSRLRLNCLKPVAICTRESAHAWNELSMPWKWVINVNKEKYPLKFDAHFVRSIAFQLRVWPYVVWLWLLLFFCVTHSDCDASIFEQIHSSRAYSWLYVIARSPLYYLHTAYFFSLNNFVVVSSSNELC